MNLDLETRLLEDLSDEAAFALCELLNELTQAFESRYYHQIQRYHWGCKPKCDMKSRS